MSLSAPLRVPVELTGPASMRWFRLGLEVSERELELGSAAPDELEGTVTVVFHLPNDPLPIRCQARAEEMVVGQGERQRAERRVVRFLDLDERSRGRIVAYVQERLGLPS